MLNVPFPCLTTLPRAVLTAALGFALLHTQGKAEPPEQTMIKKWLDNWQGVGQVVTGMNRQGDDYFDFLPFARENLRLLLGG
jgi:hypothetical protein